MQSDSGAFKAHVWAVCVCSSAFEALQGGSAELQVWVISQDSGNACKLQSQITHACFKHRFFSLICNACPLLKSVAPPHCVPLQNFGHRSSATPSQWINCSSKSFYKLAGIDRRIGAVQAGMDRLLYVGLL